MNLSNFFAELKRRNVYKVAVAYIVGGWALSQGIAQVFPVFDIPNWIIRLIVLLIIIGLPIALVLAWMFELTPQGIKRTEDVDPAAVARAPKKHAWIYVVVVGALLSIGLFLLGRYTASNTASAARAELPAKSIAVLPFENLSRDPDNAYFCEGVQDEILTRLAKVADLKVISRTSTQKYKSATDNLREIAKQLGVMHVVEGSVQKATDQVRVNVQLINAMTDAHLWADTYDRKLTDIFTVETEIAKTIADTLQAKLSGSEKKLIAKAPTANSEAYELYLKGRFFWNKRTPSELRKSIDYFRQATALDPNYAQAYAAEAQAWVILPSYNGGAPKDCGPPAESAIKKALALDETCSDAYTALGNFRSVYEFNFPGAKKEYERALELNPNDSTAHHWYGSDVLAALGDSEREIAEMERARELDPLSLVINTNLGVAFVHAGRWDDGINQLRKTVEMDESFYFARWSLGAALEDKGELSSAMAEYQKAMALADDPIAPAYSGHLNGKLGRQDEAIKILGKLLERSKSEYVDPYYLAIVYLGLGQREQALSALEKSYEDRNGNNLEYIRVDPFLGPLRGDPRFEALAEKIVPAAEFKSSRRSGAGR
ncbi:MAG TPA: tetratricopeptide repeat protein [Candidatus Udaeobacter sp.]|jgi:TolB-like protein/Tfp pilus assembly protein PilF